MSYNFGCDHGGRDCAALGCKTVVYGSDERSCSDCYEFHMCENCGLWMCADHVTRIGDLRFCASCIGCKECGKPTDNICPECGGLACWQFCSVSVFLTERKAEEATRMCRSCADERKRPKGPKLTSANIVQQLEESIQYARMGRLAKDCGIR